MNSNNLIILLGQRVRSGTNFIGSTLMMHPDVQSVPKNISHGEFNLFRSNNILSVYREVSIKSFGLKFEDHEKDVFLENYGSTWIDMLLDKYNLNPNKKIFLKSPITDNYELWRKAFPEAKFLFLTRDGRDNVVSAVNSSNDKRSWHTWYKSLIKRMNFHFGRSFYLQAKNWKYSSIIYNSIYEDKNSKKIYYENLINNRSKLSEVFDFLNLRKDNEMLGQCLNALVVGSSSGVKTDKIRKSNWVPSKDKSSFQFKRKWTKWNYLKKTTFKLIAGEELIKMGYESNNRW